jgi:hypothetical protein
MGQAILLITQAENGEANFVREFSKAGHKFSSLRKKQLFCERRRLRER